MNYTKKLAAYLIVNVVVLWIVNYFFPNVLVFGRGQISYWQALLTTAVGMTLAIMVFDLVVYDFKIKLEAEQYIVTEAIVNIGAFYLFARTPLQNSIGVGIAAFWVAIVTGFIVSAAQYVVKQYVEHRLK